MKYVMSLVLLICSTRSAHAELIVQIQRTGTSVDLPYLTLENSGPEELTGFTLSIGDSAYNFDSAAVLTGSDDVGALLLSPDELNSGLRSDLLMFDFATFGPGKRYGLRIDIDGDSGAATVDWQSVLFNNGVAPNAVAIALWGDGTTASHMLIDEPGRDPLVPYVFTLAGPVVPEPTTWILLLSGLSVVFLKRFRR